MCQLGTLLDDYQVYRLYITAITFLSLNKADVFTHTRLLSGKFELGCQKVGVEINSISKFLSLLLTEVAFRMKDKNVW